MPDELPKDLRTLSLKHPGRCRSCADALLIGDNAFWSPGNKCVWCTGCVQYLKSSHGTVASKQDAHQSWRRLCTYARQVTLAEASKSLVLFRSKDWFIQNDENTNLIAGIQDEIEAPKSLQKIFRDSDTSQRSFIYGWPTVVAPGIDGLLRLAPMFVTEITKVEPEEATGKWRMRATQDPELNLALFSGEIFPSEMALEVDAQLGGEPLPTDPILLSELAEIVASQLGLGAQSLKPLNLTTHLKGEEGVHNAAIIVSTAGFGASHTVQQELIGLASKTDWESTAAAHLLSAFKKTNDPLAYTEPLASPLETNASQEEVMEATRKNPLTVVTGPPGTGKSQLVANIVCNAWLDNETVLVSSVNNAAVDVATDRVTNGVAQALLIRTGNKQNREQLSELISSAQSETQGFPSDEPLLRAALQFATTKRSILLKALDALGHAEETVLKNSEALKKTATALWGEAAPNPLRLQNPSIIRRSNRLLRTKFFPNVRKRWLLHRLFCEGEDPSIPTLLTWAIETTYRPKYLKELKELEETIGDPSVSVPLHDEEWNKASQALVQSCVRGKINDNSACLEAFSFASTGHGRLVETIHTSLSALRGWSCTALSIKSNFKLKAKLFDLVIIDEASQCNLSSILPLAYRAKRLVIIGDVNQLSPITSLSDRHLAEIAKTSGLSEEDLKTEGKHHKNGSTFKAFEYSTSGMKKDPLQPGEGLFFLAEHYRCHPAIARWFNTAFYSDSLHVLTDTSEMDENDRGIHWVDVSGTAERPLRKNRSWVNLDEANLVVDSVCDFIRNGSRSIGVVTPFIAQAELIKKMAVEATSREALDSVGFVAGSAFTLQGNEKDIVIFSPVAAPGITKFGREWIETNRKMINVATSRARQLLLVFGHPDMPQYGGPTLTSLREYTKTISNNPDTSRYQTDSEPERLLLVALREAGLAPTVKNLVEGFELDFTVEKNGHRLNIEVDGDLHFDNRGQQVRRDIIRDRILKSCGWTVVRVRAWRCWSDLDSVVEEIMNHLAKEPSSLPHQ
jgi:very-short-patch-repair endonuclease